MRTWARRHGRVRSARDACRCRAYLHGRPKGPLGFSQGRRFGRRVLHRHQVGPANTAENGLPYTGALPLIVTSFAVMVLSTLIALPIAIGSAIFAVEISPKFGSKIFQPLIELFDGHPLGRLWPDRFSRGRRSYEERFPREHGPGHLARRHRAGGHDSADDDHAFGRWPARRARRLPPGLRSRWATPAGRPSGTWCSRAPCRRS